LCHLLRIVFAGLHLLSCILFLRWFYSDCSEMSIHHFLREGELKREKERKNTGKKTVVVRTLNVSET